MEAECRLWCDVALLGNLLVGQPTPIGKGVFNLVAVVELLFRAKTRAHFGNIQLPDAHELVAHLLCLIVKLRLIWKILPLATATHAKVPTYRLYTILRFVLKAHHSTLHKAAVSLGNLHIYDIARNGHRHENYHPLVVSHSLAFRRQSRNLQPLNQGHRTSLSCHLILFFAQRHSCLVARLCHLCISLYIWWI